MKTYQCRCGNVLFFDSTHCVTCDCDVRMCPACRSVSPIDTGNDGIENCGNRQCAAQLRRCRNDAEHAACNRAIEADDSATHCHYCRFNSVVPDLSVPENLANWRKLEAAKRRVLTVIESLGFPVDSGPDVSPALRFEFKSDAVEPVSTGHADGCISVNLREADSVEREKARLEFREPQRTLVGHFRHELGHYYWDMLVKTDRLEKFREMFGDERNPVYESAKQSYYETGPKNGWHEQFVSGYASMHPWEDFAETFGAYIDMVTVLRTARHFKILNLPNAQDNDLPAMLATYAEVGVAANELNRDMGLIDLVPEVFTPPVAEKLNFIHQLR